MSRRYYFSTRDLLMMAALAGLGGVISTYINAVGDVFQSILGFPGTNQWAAGLHVLWLVLAVGLTRKGGAGTLTGILKGGVEVLTGNTHGVIVILVTITAGLLVDLAFFLLGRRENVLVYGLAGGLAAASNVWIFQLFAALPADVLAYSVLLLVAVVAFVSGLLFGGLLAFVLVNALRRAGVVRDQPAAPIDRRVYLGLLILVIALTAGLAFFLHQALRGPNVVEIDGAVAAPYAYPRQHGDIAQITAEVTQQGAATRYTGAPLRELLERAGPSADAALLLVRGSDGYTFFVSLAEVADNPSLLLVPKGRGQDAAYDLVGPRSNKAWVRGVARLTVVGQATLEIAGALERAASFDPTEWQFQMDSTTLDVGSGPGKYQGVPLGLVLEALEPRPGAGTVQVYAAGAIEPTLSLPLDQVLGDRDLRLFTIPSEATVTFALARMDGTVLVPQVGRIEVR